MTKSEALRLLGGSTREAAERIGITRQAVEAWPEVLPDRIRDRVHAALWREARADIPPNADRQLLPKGAR